MADDDWLSAANEPDPPADSGAAAEVEAPDLLEDGAEEEEVEEKRKPQREKAERLVLYKVWKRPVNLQYSYLYDYRHNYYDDVIDYLDRRQRGLIREIPRPQTWAERALRTYTSKVRQSASYEKREKDISLLSEMRTSARFYNYHSKEYMNTRYSRIL